MAPQIAEKDPRVAVSMLADLPADRRFEAQMSFMPMMMNDPTRVIEALTELGDDSLRAEFLPTVASRWAHNDPESALDWASTLERGALRDRVLANIARPAMDFDVALAVDVIDEIDDAETACEPGPEPLAGHRKRRRSDPARQGLWRSLIGRPSSTSARRADRACRECGPPAAG